MYTTTCCAAWKLARGIQNIFSRYANHKFHHETNSAPEISDIGADHEEPAPPPQPTFFVNLVMIFNLPNMFKAEIILILLYGVLTILEKNPGHENHI